MTMDNHRLPRTFLFGDWRYSTVEAGKSPYGHTFGGPHDREGLHREECNDLHLHLIMRLNLDDPAVPIEIPGIRWLPLYYCFDYRVNEIGYRLLSDNALVTYFPSDDPHVTDKEEWPDEDYPMEFRRTEVEVVDENYAPTNPDHPHVWAAIFGTERLSPDVKQQLQDECKAWTQEMVDLGHTELLYEEYANPEDELLAYLGGLAFAQSKPVNTCLNPGCANHSVEGSLQVIAMAPSEPVPGVAMWGRWGGTTELIFEKCPLCHTIRVSNQCD